MPPAGQLPPARLRRHVATDAGEIEALAPAWRSLTREARATPFSSPDWLLPWWREHGAGYRPRVFTWWRGARLVGLAPFAWRRTRLGLVGVRELILWGVPTQPAIPLRGWVDVLAPDAERPLVLEDLRSWLFAPGARWDVLHLLRLPAGSETLAAMRAGARGSWMASLTGTVESSELVLEIPDGARDWAGPLGPKARHNLRTERRAFERRSGGRVELVADPEAVPSLVAALRDLLARRWGPAEAYFGRDPRFGSFLEAALAASLRGGTGYAHVARDPTGIHACLVTLATPPLAVPILIGVCDDDDHRSRSLGKILFQAAIEEAARRGCREFDFLTTGDYKATFWHARPRTLESAVLGRGLRGRLVVGYVLARRRFGPPVARLVAASRAVLTAALTATRAARRAGRRRPDGADVGRSVAARRSRL